MAKSGQRKVCNLSDSPESGEKSPRHSVEFHCPKHISTINNNYEDKREKVKRVPRLTKVEVVENLTEVTRVRSLALAGFKH
ncbi:hypothetical protein EV2_037008 [Malus domestica]